MTSVGNRQQLLRRINALHINPKNSDFIGVSMVMSAAKRHTPAREPMCRPSWEVYVSWRLTSWAKRLSPRMRSSYVPLSTTRPLSRTWIVSAMTMVLRR